MHQFDGKNTQMKPFKQNTFDASGEISSSLVICIDTWF